MKESQDLESSNQKGSNPDKNKDEPDKAESFPSENKDEVNRAGQTSIKSKQKISATAPSSSEKDEKHKPRKGSIERTRAAGVTSESLQNLSCKCGLSGKENFLQLWEGNNLMLFQCSSCLAVYKPDGVLRQPPPSNTSFPEISAEDVNLVVDACERCGNTDINSFLITCNSSQIPLIQCMICKQVPQEIIKHEPSHDITNQLEPIQERDARRSYCYGYGSIQPCEEGNSDQVDEVRSTQVDEVRSTQVDPIDLPQGLSAPPPVSMPTTPQEKRNDGAPNNSKVSPVVRGVQHVCNTISRFVNPVGIQTCNTVIRITDWNDLRPGDHIEFHRDLGYKHHGIVVDVDPKSALVKLLHYHGGMSEKMGGVVREDWRPLKTSPVYLVQYPEGSCYSPEEVIERARSRLGENKYALFTHNCEHFATWAKTGSSYSEQVSHFIGHSLEGGLRTLYQAPILSAAGKQLGKAISKTSSLLTKSKPAAPMVTDNLDKVPCAFKHIKAFSTALIIGFKAVDSRKKITSAKKEYKDGIIDETSFGEECVRVVTRDGVEALTSVGGLYAGDMVGQLVIPAPLLGSVVGATVGTAVGHLAGGPISSLALNVYRNFLRKKDDAKAKCLTVLHKRSTNVDTGSLLGSSSETCESDNSKGKTKAEEMESDTLVMHYLD